MKYLHVPINPGGQGLEPVADLYVAQDFDINVSANLSAPFRDLLTRQDISEELRKSLFEFAAIAQIKR